MAGALPPFFGSVAFPWARVDRDERTAPAAWLMAARRSTGGAGGQIVPIVTHRARVTAPTRMEEKPTVPAWNSATVSGPGPNNPT